MRLDKLLANLKYGSRKEVRYLIKNQDVLVNGQVAIDFDLKINEKYDKISVKGKDVYYKPSILLAIHKPIGFLSANKDNIHPVVFDLLKDPYNRFDLKMVGRLDLDAEGLMLLATDGSIVHQITHPKHHVDKVYVVKLDQPFDERSASALRSGVQLIDTDGSSYVGIAKDLSFKDHMVEITIDEGKFHQVKKMFKKLGFEVLLLKRIQIGRLKLDLAPGAYKEIELKDIFGEV